MFNIKKGVGVPIRGILDRYQMFLVFAGEQPNICTFSWYTSGRADAGLFSRYRSLKNVWGNSACQCRVF